MGEKVRKRQLCTSERCVFSCVRFLYS